MLLKPHLPLSVRLLTMLVVDCSQPLLFNAHKRKRELTKCQARGGGVGGGGFLGEVSLCAFNDQIKISENRGQGTV